MLIKFHKCWQMRANGQGKQLSTVICCNNLYTAGDEGLVLQIVMGRETWICHLNPCGSWCKAYGIPRKKKFTSVLSAGNIVVAVSWDEKDGGVTNFSPKRTKLNSDQYAERLINVNAHCHWSCPIRKIHELLLVYDSAKPHTSVCTTEAITNSGYTVLLHPHYSPDLASSDYHLFRPLTKINLWRHHYVSDKALQIVMHQWLQGGESSCYWMGIHALFQRWKKNLSSGTDHIGKHLCLQQCCIDILWENFEMSEL